MRYDFKQNVVTSTQRKCLGFFFELANRILNYFRVQGALKEEGCPQLMMCKYGHAVKPVPVPRTSRVSVKVNNILS